MYCESTAAQYNTNTENYIAASSTVMDFWARVTPHILQLLSHSKVVSCVFLPQAVICLKRHEKILLKTFWEKEKVLVKFFLPIPMQSSVFQSHVFCHLGNSKFCHCFGELSLSIKKKESIYPFIMTLQQSGGILLCECRSVGQ